MYAYAAQDDLRKFHAAIAPHLPPTTSHPSPPTFLDYAHTYSLVCTRAFLIDLYHTVALCPFADIFNHSPSDPHSSLQSDDFVCHLCGSLGRCVHDVRSTTGVVRRLEHLPSEVWEKLEKEVDSVEMRAERDIQEGEEVSNCYGEKISEGRLLVEWGFLPDDSAGDEIKWELEELGGEQYFRDWWKAMAGAGRVERRMSTKGYRGEDRLISPPGWGPLSVNDSGEVSVSLLAYLYILATASPTTTVEELEGRFLRLIDELDDVWTRSQEARVDACNLDPHHLSVDVVETIRAVRNLLDANLRGMHRPDLSVEVLCEMRDVSKSRAIEFS